MAICFEPVAFVRNSRLQPEDDYWGAIISEIVLADALPTEAFLNISDFSHLEILFYFDQTDAAAMRYASHPRGNTAFPKNGIFAQRKKDRPNPIGLTTVELLAHDDRQITVRGLDAINGTPVLDIKPVFKEFAPRTSIRQPTWVSELMRNYWK